DRDAVFRSDSVRRSGFFAAENERAWRLIEQPLVAVVEQGRADGRFAVADPAAAARFIRAVVADAAGLAVGAPPPDRRDPSLDEVLEFCLRGLGGLAAVAPTP